MPEIIDLLRSSAKIDARLRQGAVKPPVRTPSLAPQTVSVYKITDGERGERASKAGLTQAEAETWISQRPDNKYDIVAE